MSGFIGAFYQAGPIAVIVAALINHLLIWRAGRLKYYYSSMHVFLKRRNFFRSIDKSPELAEFHSMIMRFVWMTLALTVILMIVKAV